MTTRWVSRMSYVERYASLSDYLCPKCLNMPQEWIPSLPLHLDLYASLKIAPPTFGHMPILLNPDGSKMSKRHGDVQVIDFIVRITSILYPLLYQTCNCRSEAGSLTPSSTGSSIAAMEYITTLQPMQARRHPKNQQRA